MPPGAGNGLAYIMDTFPIVRRKDEAAHGHYRTKRVILEIYDEMATAIAAQGSPGAPGISPGHEVSGLVDAPDESGLAAHSADSSPDEQAVREPAPTLELKSPPASKPKAKAKSTPDLSAQPTLVTEFTPPAGGYAQRLKRVMALGQPKNQAELAELIAALGDENNNIRWLAGSSLTKLGGLTVVNLLARYLETEPGDKAQDQALKVLQMIAETDEDEAVQAASQEVTGRWQDRD